MSDIVRIGCAAGFWGDSAMAPPQLAKSGQVDYIVFDYLAEITMSILARQHARDPAMGHAADFTHIALNSILHDIAERRIRIVSNAGGINPAGCAAAIRALVAKAGLDLKVAAVTGDDVMPWLAGQPREKIREMFTGQTLPEGILSANAYLGALPIARALAEGADIVVTGRCADSALVLGPLIHEFAWAADDYDRLAQGSLAGHIIECGAQCTGGIFTDWETVPDWQNIGYPIAECAGDGSFTITKPEGTGGIVTRATVAEQLVYEIGDPARYILPDVICDFTDVRIEETGINRVQVRGARGSAPTDSYKVSATWADGYRIQAAMTIIGENAAARARRQGEALLQRIDAMLRAQGMAPLAESLVDAIGADSAYGPGHCHANPREVVLRLAARHPDRRALALFAREITSAGTSMSPATTGFAGGRPKPSPVVRLFSFLIGKHLVHPQVNIDDRILDVPQPLPAARQPSHPPRRASGGPAGETGEVAPSPSGEIIRLPLRRLAWARSGDKGNDANIGVIARHPDYLPVLRRQLSAGRIGALFAHLGGGRVHRYELPGIGGFNFLLEACLGGGGIVSLRNDPQGKGLAQILLDTEIDIPAGLLHPAS